MAEDKRTSENLGNLLGKMRETQRASIDSLGGPSSAEALAQLEKRLQNEQDARRQDWFLFIVAVVVVFDAFIFTGMENWMAPLVIGILELVGLILVARKCGVEEVDQLVDRAISAVSKNNGSR